MVCDVTDPEVLSGEGNEPDEPLVWLLGDDCESGELSVPVVVVWDRLVSLEEEDDVISGLTSVLPLLLLLLLLVFSPDKEAKVAVSDASFSLSSNIRVIMTM